MTNVPSADAKAVVRALDALSTHVRRVAEALLTPVVRTELVADDEATTPSTTCSAEYHGPGRLPTRCIRAGHHDVPRHTDECGFHWSDGLAVYPVHGGPVKISRPFPHPLELLEDERPLREYVQGANEEAPNMLRVLADRAARGVLTEGEGAALRRRVEQLISGRATWKAKAEEIERDRDQHAAELEELRAVLKYEHKRANDAIDREETAEQAAEEQRRRADIFETELRVLRAGLRANGADPTQIQNLWAQIRLRNRQWAEAKREARLTRSMLEEEGGDVAIVDEMLSTLAKAEGEARGPPPISMTGLKTRYFIPMPP